MRTAHVRIARALVRLALALGTLATCTAPALCGAVRRDTSGTSAHQSAARDTSGTFARGGAGEPSGARLERSSRSGLWPPRFEPRNGAVHWSVPADSGRHTPEPRLFHGLRLSRSPQDSISAWLAAAEADSLLAPLALTEAARLWLAAGDSAHADSALDRAVGRGGPWQWRALRQRVRLAKIRSGPATADSLLGSEDRAWIAAERAAWLEERIGLRLLLGDTATAVVLSRRAIRSYPRTQASARILERLEAVLSARRESPGWAEEQDAAIVDVARGDPAAAARRLERAFIAAPGDLRWQPALHRGRLLRAGRHYGAAREALAQADSVAPDSSARAQVLLERARVEIDARSWREAEVLLAEAASWPDSRVRELAITTYARALEAQGAWERALDAYVYGWRTGAWRNDQAMFRAGLMGLASGQPDSAQAWFGRSKWEGARFWEAVLLRRSRPAEADSMLMAIASRAGYDLYSTAARDTLGRRGWPGVMVAVPSDEAGASRIAELLLRLGREDDAKEVVERWLEWDPRFRDAREFEDELLWQDAVAAAAVAYASGWNPLALHWATEAVGGAPDSSDSSRWSVVAWLYPPAFDTAFAALPESLPGPSIDRALVRAVAWKESRFDPRARSRSNALGLLQLKLGTAADEARRLREPVPRGADDLFDPERNVRYGSAYLERLLARFGSVPRALAAYNAGPAALARWLDLWEKAPGRAIGGAALECELTCRPETVNYVKEILAARQAYRELRPTKAP